ncbi:hypothetical protein [Streptomyces sp. SID12488]|uniref:hypothetical protein n=1 Tax=Streptomyces sp. SID12488 TaxID=2706040 RepID=UPI0013D9929B|nr:hypothetical protein [Streptomyces sp. SID12488]NEA68121.1 hypothetical protein [Streptomyces sp. SID12488]
MPPPIEETDDCLAADVAEFARHDRSGGWALAHLVARRVEYDAGRGVTLEQQAKRSDRNIYRQISGREFARRAKTNVKRVLALHDAWVRAAADGRVPSVEKVATGEFVELPDEEEVPFYGEHGYYRGYQARMPAGERRQALEAESERLGVRPGVPVYVSQHPGAVRAAVLADEGTRTAAMEGIAEFNRREAQEQDRAHREAAQRADEQRARELDGGAGTWPAEADGTDGAMDAGRAAAAVRAAAEPTEMDAALQIFNELAQVRMGTLRALSLLQRHQVHFSDDRGRAVSELCDASRAAIDFIRDLAASQYTTLDDEALRAFLDESEKLG